MDDFLRDSVSRYFESKKDSDYYLELTHSAKTIICNRPQYWEDKLFREVLRAQRQYLNSYFPIETYNNLSQYVFGISSSENLASHIERMKNSLSSVTKFAKQINKLLENFKEARGQGVPGNVDEIVQCARDCFSSYIFHIEMLYDINYLYMPNGDKIKNWIEKSIWTIIKEYDNYILDEFDSLANELAETGKCEKELFQKQININLDLNDVAAEWAIAVWDYDKMNRKVIYYIPMKVSDFNEKELKNEKILISPDIYEEYIALKNEKIPE